MLHGGEPLLAGSGAEHRLVTTSRAAAGAGVTVPAGVQTNEVGLSNAYLRLR